ncbi:MAG: hypothetical protein FWG51_02220 [Firmicutes bacterium]|nr:hypothetical protein [Bacillota bacterium]
MKNIFKIKQKREVKGEGVVSECRLIKTRKESFRVVRLFDVYIQIADSSKNLVARIETYEFISRTGATGNVRGLGTFGKIVNATTKVAVAGKTVHDNVNTIKSGPSPLIIRPYQSGDRVAIFYDGKKPKQCVISFSAEHNAAASSN